MSIVFYKGPSMLTGAPITGVITGEKNPSRNQQTGDMLTAWFLPDEEKPTDAVKSGADEAVCGRCTHRKGGSNKRCYVQVFRAPLALWKYTRGMGLTPMMDVVKLIKRKRKPIRLGGWGDPASVPRGVLEQLVSAAPGHTGYTSSWRVRPDLAGLVMASTNSVEETLEAQQMGFRTYRVADPGEPGPTRDLGEVWCPTTKKPWVRCDLCGQCNGSSRSYTVPAHGAGLSKSGEYKKFWAQS